MKKKPTYGLLLLFVSLLAVGSGCIAADGEEAEVKFGDAVRVHYTGTFENGTVFDSSTGREPLGFIVGNGAVIPGFEEGVVGMRVGETKTLHIPVDRAYGPHRDDLVFVFDLAEVADGESLTVGDGVELSLQNGLVLPATVVAVSADEVVVDANHRLAGEDLTFTVTLVEIV